MSDGELSFQVHLVSNNIPEGYATISIFDINNPSDIMPIAIEHGIGITPHGEVWMANNFNVDLRAYKIQTVSYDENPYRAIACCYLKIMEKKK